MKSTKLSSFLWPRYGSKLSNCPKASYSLSGSKKLVIDDNGYPISMSRFQERRGKPHSVPFRQVKGVVTPVRTVPAHIVPHASALGGSFSGLKSSVHTDAVMVAKMKAAGAYAAEVLDRVGEYIKAGVTTDYLDEVVHQLCIERNIYPAPLHFTTFPKSVCSSVNEVVCHGIPDSTVLQDGDIVKLDVSIYKNGVFGDNCRSWIVGDKQNNYNRNFKAPAVVDPSNDVIDADGRKLVVATKEALDLAVMECGPGKKLSDICRAIMNRIEVDKFESVDMFAGHGIGEEMHCAPSVMHVDPNRLSARGNFVMKEGMTFTIEPMITEGTNAVETWDDRWTIVTVDRGRAAQFEHTVLITSNGCEVLTKYEF